MLSTLILAPAPTLPATTFVIWLSRHQWSLIQTGEAEPEVAQALDGRRSVVAAVEVDAGGEPRVLRAWLATRSRLGFRRRLALPAGAQAVVRFVDD
jgi:hypothetical protein